MRGLHSGWLCVVLLWGCDVALPQGAFRCAVNADCPAGWSCRGDRLCYEGSDSISGAESPDAATDAGDGAMRDDGSRGDLPGDAGGDEPTGDSDAAMSGEAGDAGHADLDDASAPPAADGGGTPEPPPPPSEPFVDGPCSPNGAKACRGHASFDKLVCQSGRWQIIGVCDGDFRCNSKPGPSLGSCQPIAALCLDKNPGDPVCDGLERKRCDADLLGYEPNACPANSHCASDVQAGVQCACDSGYADDGAGGCTNVDDCGNHTCAPGTCVDGVHAYTCDCPSGFASAGMTCANVNDCPSVDPCTPGSCVDAVNAFSCSCPSGYTSAGTSCTNVNDCPSVDPCGPGSCVDQVNAYTCSCPSGYTNTGTGCVNANDCPGNNPCSPGTCVDGLNDYSCSCPSGFAPAGHSCQNVDDCPRNNECDPGVCIDQVNGFYCECPECFASAGTYCYFACDIGGGF